MINVVKHKPEKAEDKIEVLVHLSTSGQSQLNYFSVKAHQCILAITIIGNSFFKHTPFTYTANLEIEPFSN
jgi:hypothetical protein